MTADAPSAIAYVRILAAVLDRLPPDEAGGPACDAARALIASMNKAAAQSPNSYVLPPTADGLARLAGRLDPQTATESVRALLAVMGRMKNPVPLGTLDLHITALLARLPPEQRDAVARDVAHALSAAVAQGLAQPGQANLVLDQLTAVADQLDGDAAADAAHALTDAMAKEVNEYQRGNLARR